jgi:hypothetical protein
VGWSEATSKVIDQHQARGADQAITSAIDAHAVTELGQGR